MTTASIQPPPHIRHATIVSLDGASDIYCALTIHRDGDHPHCAITRRIGSHTPNAFLEAAQYVKSNLFFSRRPETIIWIDHTFEKLVNREILHHFEFVRFSAADEITRDSFDLKTHEAWATRVQHAVTLLLKLGA